MFTGECPWGPHQGEGAGVPGGGGGTVMPANKGGPSFVPGGQESVAFLSCIGQSLDMGCPWKERDLG